VNKKSFWGTLVSVVLAAALAAVVAYLLYYYRDNLRAIVNLVKEKGKKLLNSCCDEFSDFEDL